jgi:hypothetical protein
VSELKLTFYDDPSNGQDTRIHWPPDKHRLLAFLRTDDNAKLVFRNLILANMPRGYRIYFATGSLDALEHQTVKDRLTALEEPFEERVDSAKVQVGLFRRHEVERISTIPERFQINQNTSHRRRTNGMSLVDSV